MDDNEIQMAIPMFRGQACGGDLGGTIPLPSKFEVGDLVANVPPKH